VRGQRHAPAAPYPRERPGTHCTEAWVGFRAGLDRCGKSPGFDPRIVQPVGRRYTDYATRPTTTVIFLFKLKQISYRRFLLNTFRIQTIQVPDEIILVSPYDVSDDTKDFDISHSDLLPSEKKSRHNYNLIYNISDSPQISTHNILREWRMKSRNAN